MQVEKVNLAADPRAESDKSQEKIIAEIFAFPFEGALLTERAILTEKMCIRDRKKEWAKLLFLTTDLTQAEIAVKIGVSRITIVRWAKEWEGLKLNFLQRCV